MIIRLNWQAIPCSTKTRSFEDDTVRVGTLPKRPALGVQNENPALTLMSGLAAGQWRGGIGAVREFMFLDDAGFSLEGDGHAFQPWGSDSGADGHVASLTLVRPDGTRQELPSKVPSSRSRLGTGSSLTGLVVVVMAMRRRDPLTSLPKMSRTS